MATKAPNEKPGTSTPQRDEVPESAAAAQQGKNAALDQRFPVPGGYHGTQVRHVENVYSPK